MKPLDELLSVDRAAVVKAGRKTGSLARRTHAVVFAYCDVQRGCPRQELLPPPPFRQPDPAPAPGGRKPGALSATEPLRFNAGVAPLQSSRSSGIESSS